MRELFIFTVLWSKQLLNKMSNNALEANKRGHNKLKNKRTVNIHDYTS